MTSIAPPLAFVLSVVGAGFFQSSKRFFNDMTHIKRNFAAEALTDIVLHEDHIPRNLDLPPKDLERVRQSWVTQETHIRIAFLCYLLNVEVGRLTSDDQRLLPHSHPALSNLPLPSSETLWNAESAPAWRKAWLFTQMWKLQNMCDDEAGSILQGWALG
ncbi:hypothetical protein JCM10449v2_005139 [Rhodotorula kratochvilovae]